MTMRHNCDVSPMKEQLKIYLRHIAEELESSLAVLDREDRCLLSKFDEIRESFKTAESLAASFYLQCYLSAYTSHYADLSAGIQHLSERRHGALIVIERSDPLDAYMHSGILVGATLTHSLLESIFYPGSPLHDGAVLIQADRIVSAANVLPVSSAAVTDKKLGTRHRAALGLSERTDALVLVVSEESGSASFALEGKLHPINGMAAYAEQIWTQ